MKNTFLLLTLLLSACSPTKKTIEQDGTTNLDSIQTEIIETKVVETEPKEEHLIYWYIYSNGDNKEPSDSLGWYRSDYEKSLALYNDVDNLSKTVHNIGLHVSIFKLENEKFALLADNSKIGIYKFTENKYQKIHSVTYLVGFSSINLNKIDINSDNYKDAFVEISSGGSYGNGYLFLFYNPVTKSLEYDNETELRNVKLNIKKQEVFCSYKVISKLYKIEKFSFRVIEEAEYLKFNSDKQELENKKEITKYDKEGKIISIDTVCVE
ncbi:hypothetical protein WAF17_10155 [Bernardetia sp. ABR2-2B]|uniref:hypothetical protein n=1 Tax=Bernardetia sp. ABR2-2B TaxID=3127472 RepID=UPI0030D0539F